MALFLQMAEESFVCNWSPVEKQKEDELAVANLLCQMNNVEKNMNNDDRNMNSNNMKMNVMEADLKNEERSKSDTSMSSDEGEETAQSTIIRKTPQLTFEEDSDPESPYPPHMRPKTSVAVDPQPSWEVVGTQIVCLVKECKKESFSRMFNYRRHWEHKHCKIVSVYFCTENCKYSSLLVYDVKRHLENTHHLSKSLIDSVWLKASKMKNNKYRDPGVLGSPPRLPKETKRKAEKTEHENPKKQQLSITASSSNRVVYSSTPVQEIKFASPKEVQESKVKQSEQLKEDPQPAQEPNKEHLSLLFQAGEAKRLKEMYERKETNLRKEYQMYEVKIWKKKYEDTLMQLKIEARRREEAERKCKAIEDTLKTKEALLKQLSNPKLLAIAELLKN